MLGCTQTSLALFGYGFWMTCCKYFMLFVNMFIIIKNTPLGQVLQKLRHRFCLNSIGIR